MKKTSRILAIVLALVMVLSGSVFAAWVSFQNDDTNNGVITGTAPTTTNYQVNNDITLPHGYVSLDVPPVIDSSGNAYCLVSAQNTTRLVKVNLANATIDTSSPWNGTGSGNEGIEIQNTSAFQLSTPVIDNGYVYVASTAFAQKNTDENFQTLPYTTSDWTKTITTGTPGFAQYLTNYIKVTNNGMSSNVAFTLSQTFEGVAGDNLRIECAVLGSGLNYGTYSVYLNSSTTPLVSFDLTQPIGYAFNNNVSHDDLQDGTNTVKIVIEFTGNSKDTYVQLGTFKLFEEQGSVERVDCSTGAKTLVVDGISGQLNTPLTIKDNKLYFGSYSYNGGVYYQVPINGTFPATKAVFNSGKSHYWSGAYVSDSYAYFGSYEGKLYWPSVANFSADTTHVINVGQEISIAAGDICSSICFDGDSKIYFTSKNGYLWCYDISGGNPTFSWYANLGAPSTSTPVVSPSGKIYVGTYTGFPQNTGTVVAVTPPATPGPLDYTGSVNTVYSGDAVQSSVIVKSIYTPGSRTDYLYFTTNAISGCGYIVKYNPNTSTVLDTKNTSQYGTGFTLQGMAAHNGYLVFGNDDGELFIIH